MPNLYKPTNISTQSWFRSYRVVIENALNEIPAIKFSEEEVLVVNDKKIKISENTLIELMTNPNKTYELLNPETDELMGTVTYKDLYIMLYSLYKKLALDRDKK